MSRVAKAATSRSSVVGIDFGSEKVCTIVTLLLNCCSVIALMYHFCYILTLLLHYFYNVTLHLHKVVVCMARNQKLEIIVNPEVHPLTLQPLLSDCTTALSDTTTSTL